jgi:YidC/Oxa1 family membrane protein insertase
VLNFIYYPVSAILWFWHKAFGFVLGESNGFAWMFSVVFLVFTLRALLYKPFVSQVRSMRKMQEFAPEIQKLKKKYGNDKQKMALEMQKLQGEHGVNPLGGCLPIFVQMPVFIGLFHVLKGFNPSFPDNYVFNRADIVSFNEASVLGAKLGAAIKPYAGGAPMEAYGTSLGQQLVVLIPLAIAAAIFTHITARHSIARQTEAQAANPQAAMMNKLMLWLFPIGAIAGSPFLPLAILVYWVANNLWTLGQQRVVYTKIDSEESEKKARKIEVQKNLGPKVGQKPIQDLKKPSQDPRQKKPGAKPIAPRGTQNGKPAPGATAKPEANTNGTSSGNGSGNGSKPQAGGSVPNTAFGEGPSDKRGRKR